MKVQVYYDQQHKEHCIVFYSGRYFVLYANMYDEDFKTVMKVIEKGFNNKDLISLDTKSFKERKTFLYEMEIKSGQKA